jgi:hypothetical protein
VVNDTLPEPAVSFPGKDPVEEFRFYFRRHWIHPARSVGYLILWMIMFGLITYASGVSVMEDQFSRRATIAGLCVFMLIPHFVFLSKIYKHFLSIVILTDRKIHRFKRTLIAVDRHESVDLIVIQDINKSQRGIVQNMLGFGTLILEAPNTQLRIHFVPHINEVYENIVRLRELARWHTKPELDPLLQVQPS